MALSQAEVIAKLETRRDVVLEEIATLDSTKAGGLPDAALPHAVQHQAYKKGLYDELRMIEEQIAEVGGGDPFEIVTEASA